MPVADMTTARRLSLARIATIACAATWLVGGPPAVAAEPGPGGPEAEAAALIARLRLEESDSPVRDQSGWRRPQRVLIATTDPERIGWMQDAAPGVELVGVDTLAAAVAAAPGADAVVGLCNPEVLGAGANIRWVQIFSAGAERCLAVPPVGEGKVLLTNMQRVAGPVMSEHVLAMMLGLARGLAVYIPAQAQGTWDRGLVEGDRMWTLEGKTVLVVGLGGIGIEVARRASALGMTVDAVRASGRTGPSFVRRVGLPGDLERYAAEADFVVNTTPLTDATRGMFDARFFEAVRQGSYFINVGRGQSVVTGALMDALRSGRLGGAGLDVTDPEPLPADHPLWKIPNVIITPHVSARTDLGATDRWLVARENLRRYVAGERMLSVVDPAKGY
jgi:phosphoglycerate dehydrogenase-like enzyme